jgi:CRISPR-associated endonuclease Csn1
MKKILGLDLGTNSIGWAVVNEITNDEGFSKLVGIEATGSRIIPMDATLLGDFDKGNSISQTAERTRIRGVRRLLERCLLRRERLNRVLDIIGFLPKHYAEKLNRYGQIINGEEPKIAWVKNDIGQYEFLFKDSFNEMLEELENKVDVVLTDKQLDTIVEKFVKKIL